MSYWEQVKKYHSEDREYNYFGHAGDVASFIGGGVEIEFDTARRVDRDAYREKVAEILLTSAYANHYFVEEDKSLLNGMELVTQPHTIEALRDFLKNGMTPILERIKNETESENFSKFAAVHVHISKLMFGSTVETQTESLAKLWFFMSQNWVKMLEVCNRKHYLRCEYPEPKLTKETALAKVAKELNPETKTIRRYQALNLKPESTVEFRAAQATTDITTLTAIIEMLWHLAKKSKTIAWENAKDWAQWFADAPQVVVDYLKTKE